MSSRRAARLLVALAAIVSAWAPAAAAQLASSPNYTLAECVLDGGGGAAASLEFAAYATVGLPSGGSLLSPRYIGNLGLVETAQPAPQLEDAPLVFGVLPDFGSKAGGTPITVSGFNFDKLGVGPSVTVDVGGQPATGVTVLSNTQLTALTPAGSSGSQPLDVASSLGATQEPEAFVYTPALLTTPQTHPGGPLQLRNYGTPGHHFHCLVSLTPGAVGTQFGTLLVGLPFQILLTAVPYPGPDGVHALTLKLPSLPALVGLTVRFQSLDLTQVSPAQGQFTNAATTVIVP